MEDCVATTFEEMCRRENLYVQRGMYFRNRPDHSLFIISPRSAASYDDAIETEGSVLIYQGHDAQRSAKKTWPKLFDQPEAYASGRPTPNGLFHAAAQRYRAGSGEMERVQVYRKQRQGLWFDLGIFYLVDSWKEFDGRRQVFKFKLRSFQRAGKTTSEPSIGRQIPSHVLANVWNRDGGRCVVCGATEDLHFDHILPFSAGGSSLTEKNIQLLCSKHNLKKSNNL